MGNLKITHKEKDYELLYSIERYTDGKREVVEHTLIFKGTPLKGKSLDEAVRKFQKLLERRR
jgi:hypothetical protein